MNVKSSLLLKVLEVFVWSLYCLTSPGSFFFSPVCLFCALCFIIKDSSEYMFFIGFLFTSKSKALKHDWKLSVSQCSMLTGELIEQRGSEYLASLLWFLDVGMWHYSILHYIVSPGQSPPTSWPSHLRLPAFWLLGKATRWRLPHRVCRVYLDALCMPCLTSVWPLPSPELLLPSLSPRHPSLFGSFWSVFHPDHCNEESLI